MTALVVGTLATAALLLALRPRPIRPVPAPEPLADESDPADWVGRGRRLWPPLALLAGWAFGGGWGGLVLGAVAAVVVHRVVETAEPAARRREREAVRRDLPVLVLLLATVLRGGAGAGPAARQVCAALPGPAADRLAVVGDQIALGVDPERVWAALAADPELAPLGRALARAERTGAPVAAVLARLADELATAGRADVEDRARAVGVRAAIPLGVCLLPAFLLLGIVPLVASLVSGIRLCEAGFPNRTPSTRRPRSGHSTARPSPVARRGRSRRESGRGTAPGRRHDEGESMTQTTSRSRSQAGITTAEYAVGTAAGAGLAGLLYKLLSGGFGDQLLRSLFDHVLRLLGIG